MDKIFNWTSTVIGIVGGYFAAIFGRWDSILWALLVIAGLKIGVAGAAIA